ncbi:MAG: DUF1824 family protein [Synechococcales cyanobacterium M58_A2018_015]|nr:DUF1824 family protein [Synechococcales cyanobacterium M58_A2018_015]
MHSGSISSLEDAHALLKRFDCVHQDATLSSIELATLRQALLVLCDHSDYQILGICADSLSEGQQALQTYAAALGYTINPTFADIAGPVYIKFNPSTGLCYANAYIGDHRGVLVACQSADDSGISDIYGHLPLHLFSEAVS